MPETVKDLRNISCTPLVSKVLEHFVLKGLQSHMSLSRRQFGNIKGTGIDHFLCKTWHKVLENLEDQEAASNLMSVDFSKAFNRMDHRSCVNALDKAGVPVRWRRIVQAFLHGRVMSVHVDDNTSRPMKVPGGSPQGSVLGGFLFCATTDYLGTRDSDDDDMERDARNPNATVPFEDNGRTVDTDEETVASISPIGPPPGVRFSPDHSDYQSDDEDEPHVHFGRRVNWLDSTVLSHRDNQTAIDIEIGQGNWTREKPVVMAYIDDYNVVEKVRITDAICHFSQNRPEYFLHATQSEKMYDLVEKDAEEIGMIVNPTKTQMLCIHQKGAEVSSYINTTVDSERTRIKSTGTLKILGFYFGNKPDPSNHVRQVVKAFNSKLWSLHYLSDSGMREADLLYIYKATLRPFLDFAVPSYSSMLTATMEADLERLQMRAAKIIFGHFVSYGTVVDSGRLESLKTRRKKLTENFARKTALNPRYQSWFPLNTEIEHHLRTREKYLIPRFRTERYNKSPIINFRRILNSDEKK